MKLDNDKHRTNSPVLALCYPKVLTLREYLLTRLPTASRVRRKRLETFSDPAQTGLLDTCLVGVLNEPSPETQKERAQEFVVFTQTQGTASACLTGREQSCSIEEVCHRLDTAAKCAQANHCFKVVGFAVWLLFKKCPSTLARPKHLLCNSLRKWPAPKAQDNSSVSTLALPGLFQQHPNENLDRLRRNPWDRYLSLLGPDGEAIFSSLLLDCGLFVRLSHGNHNYLQFSGTPVSDLNGVSGTDKQISPRSPDLRAAPRKPSDISFVRSRILYAKPSLNKRGIVQFGLKHVHVLQRRTQLHHRENTIHVMKHIFPRQFGYHNVFTSQIDPREIAQRFPDYTYREQEFSSHAKHTEKWMPRRLRGACESLVHQLRKQHARCSYTQLVRHYCWAVPKEVAATRWSDECLNSKNSSSTSLVTQPPPSTKWSWPEHPMEETSQSDFSFLSHATPVSQVSAFCRSVIRRLLPRNAFGTGHDGEHNWSIVLSSIDKFVQRRRFETMYLHEICSNFRVRCISWLQPLKIQQHSRMSKTDREKRFEILHELLYYTFDSLLIPLIRSNFYVTESGFNRNKLFFFRHDVWRKLSEPSLAILRLKIYQPLKPKEIRNVFDSRTLGYSNVRLLPKAEGARPITNLKRRMLSLYGNRRVLGPSINAQLGPIFSALGYERQQQPAQLGSSIFSIGGLHQKLKHFKSMIPRGEKMYFVKVDIHSCFDTIPQGLLLETVAKIINHAQYRVTRYTELKPSESMIRGSAERCRQKFANLAQPAEDGSVLSELVATEIVKGKHRRVLMESGNEKVWQRGQLMRLLKEHVQHNIVRIGKKHLKQTGGIPQGSVLSSILCSFFYSDFEMKHLDFLQPSRSMLVRLIDDFMLITTDKVQARQFLQVMIKGNQAYGISVNPDKTLANFEAQLGHLKIPRYQGRDGFPFCGMAIDTSTLEVRKDWQRKDKFVSNGLTVDAGRRPTATFRRKVLLSFKMQLHAMLLDVTLNSPSRIVATYLEAFEETAMKMHQYSKNMPPHTRPAAASTRELIQELIKVALKLGQKKQMGTSADRAHSPIPRVQMAWIAAQAFERVLLPKQQQYRTVLPWLRSLRGSCEATIGTTQKGWRRSFTVSDRVVDGCVY